MLPITLSDGLQYLHHSMQSMIRFSEQEWQHFSAMLTLRHFRKMEAISIPGVVPDEVFFIVNGLIRVVITDRNGREHTQHFALERQFIADYSCYIQQQPALYTLQALEDTTVVVLPRAAIEWGYTHMSEGQKMGRLIAEYYFSYKDNRISEQYNLKPVERYERIQEIFPDIHNRVPQHMIASYLGITSVHLSRLKKNALLKT